MQIPKSVFLLAAIIFLNKVYAQQNDSINVLIVTSSQHTYGDTNINSANHFEEIVVAYDVFIKAGLEVHFVSPEGGPIPLGYIKTSDSIQMHYLYDEKLMGKLKSTLTPAQASEISYSAVYFSGGGAAMFGVPENEEIQEITSKIFRKGGVVSAICHGTAGISMIKSPDGKYLFENRRITGYPDAFERKDAPYYKTFPFSIEKSIRRSGGVFQFSEKGWDGFYIIDGSLVTGQDPTATEAVAREVVSQIFNQ